MDSRLLISHWLQIEIQKSIFLLASFDMFVQYRENKVWFKKLQIS